MTAPSPMSPLLGERVFAVGDDAYHWDDVYLSAARSGEWTALAEQVRHGLACVQEAKARGSLPTPGEVQAAADAFRYEHDLIAAREATEWLASWRLTAGDWTAYLRRAILRARWPDARALVSRHPVGWEQIEPLLGAEAVCSGSLVRFARGLAERVAAATRATADGEDMGTHRLRSSIAADGVSPLGALPADRLQSLAERLSRIDAGFERFRGQALTAKAVRREIERHRLDWIRFECRTLAYASEHRAREAALCVREDGVEPAELARRTHTTLRKHRVYLDEVEAEVRSRLLSARAGELVGPIRVGEEFLLFVVDEKAPPSERDPIVQQRAADHVLRTAVEGEVRRVVRWSRPL